MKISGYALIVWRRTLVPSFRNFGSEFLGFLLQFSMENLFCGNRILCFDSLMENIATHSLKLC